MLPSDNFQTDRSHSSSLLIGSYDDQHMAIADEVFISENRISNLGSCLPKPRYSVLRVQKTSTGTTPLKVNVIVKREKKIPKTNIEYRLVYSHKEDRLASKHDSLNTIGHNSLEAPVKCWSKDDRIGENDKNHLWPFSEYDKMSTIEKLPSEIDEMQELETYEQRSELIRVTIPVHAESSEWNGKCRILPSSMKASGQYPCPQEGCSSVLNTPTALRKHRLVHQPKRFACCNCGKEFVERTKLNRHMLVHTRVQPFACDFEGCTKMFSLKSNLKAHMKIHTGDKQYRCIYCAHAFSHPYNLKVHVLRRHPSEHMSSDTL